MANYVIVSDSNNASYDGNLETANGFYKASGYNLGCFSTTRLALNTTRYVTWTPAQAATLQGIVLALGYSGVTSANCTSSFAVTVQLQQNTGSWVNVGTAVTLTSAQLINDSGTYRITLGGAFIPFKGINHAVTTDANTWRIVVTESGAGGILYLNTSDGTNPFFVAWDSTTTSWVDNTGADVTVPIIVDAITANASFTTKGILGTGETNRSTGMVVCRSSDATVANVALFKLVTDPVSASTWNQDGIVLMGSHSGIRCGTSAAKNTIAKKWSIIVKYTPTSGTVQNSGIREIGSISAGGIQFNLKRSSLFFYGEVPTYTNDTLTYDVAIGGTFTAATTDILTKSGHVLRSGVPTPFQCSSSGTLPAGLSAATTYWAMYINTTTFYAYPTYADALADTNKIDITDTGSGTHTLNSVVITDHSTGWLSGDVVAFPKRNCKGGTNIDYTYYVLSGDASGTTFLITPNLASFTSVTGGQVMNLSRRGIEIKSDTANQYARYSLSSPSNLTYEGVYFYNFEMRGMFAGSPQPSYDDAVNRSQYLIKNCGSWNYSSLAFFSSAPSLNENGLLADGNMFHCSYLFGVTPSAVDYFTGVASGSMTVQNCIHYYPGNAGYLGTTYGPGAVASFTNNWFYHGYSCFASFYGTRGSIAGNHFWGYGSTSNSGASGAFTPGGMTETVFDGNYYDNCDIGLSFIIFAESDLVFNNEVFSSLLANTDDISVKYGVGGYVKATFNECVGINNFDTSNMYLMLDGTLIKFVNCTGSDIISNYDSYLAYGVVTSNNSNKIYQQNNHADYTLVNSYKFGSQVVTGYPIYVAVSCQIEAAAFYAGTHTKPNITIDYDDGTTSAAVSALGNTNVQVLSDIITPTTDNNDIFVNFNQKTDASFADSKVGYYDLVMNLRKYGYTFIDTTTTIYQTLSTIQQVMTTPVVNPYITVSTAATVGAYTEFTIDHSAGTCTITADTTLARLYDYSQWDLANDGGANGGAAQWFTTLDGTNFTSTYDIVLNTGVDLTGGGSINVGAGTFTKTGTATYDGIIIYTASREVHLTLAGLVAGSTVQVYDNDTTTELYNDVVAGTSLNYVFTYTADTELRIRVRKAGYIPYEYTGDIVNTGLSLNVAQDVDDIYIANGIDGSTVTEFSLSGSTIKIYIDDPDNTTTGQRIYNWYMYVISTITYIGIQPNDITAQTAWSYILADEIQFYNQDAVNPVFIQGANINNVTGNGQVIDITGGMVNINGYFPFNSVLAVGEVVKTAILTDDTPFAGADIAKIKTDTTAILLDTAEIGIAGVGLTTITDKTNLIPSSPAIEDNIQSHVTDALTAYDPPTRTEATSDKEAIIAVIPDVSALALESGGNVAAIKAVTDKVDTTVVLDGAVYQFTSNALELTPATDITSQLAALLLAIQGTDGPTLLELDNTINSIPIEKIEELYTLFGLDSTAPLTVTLTSRTAGGINQTISIDTVNNKTTVTRI